MATEEDGGEEGWRSKTRLTLEETLHVIAFRRDLGREDYEARLQGEHSWHNLARIAEEVGQEPALRGHVRVLLPTRNRPLLVEDPQYGWGEPSRVPVKKAVEDGRQADAIERAFRDLCDAAYQSEVQVEGLGPSGHHEDISPLLFVPGSHGAPTFSYPPFEHDTTEHLLAIVWEEGGAVCQVWKNVHVDRASLERWLEPQRPDPAQFEPMDEVYWTIPMAVAWLRSRSAEAVRGEWDIWLEQCLVRRYRDDGSYLEPERRASLAVLTETEHENKLAWSDLLNALKRGQIGATGIDIQTGRRVTIPKEDWASLEDQTTGEPDFAPKFRHQYDPEHRAPVHGYDDVLIGSDDVQRLWSATSTQVPTDNCGASSHPRRGRGAPVEYPEDDILVEEVLATLERDPRTVMRPLILNLALKHGCHPDLLDDMDRLVDRVRKKVKKTRDRITDQKAD